MSTTLAARFREAWRRTRLEAVLATDGPAGRSGLTVSTLCSLSMEPPSVIVCIHRKSRSLPVILKNAVFTANALAEDQARIARGFAGQMPELREDRFVVGSWNTLSTGAPALIDAAAAFDCRVSAIFDYGSHRIIVGEVIDLIMRETNPLVHSNRTFYHLSGIGRQ